MGYNSECDCQYCRKARKSIDSIFEEEIFENKREINYRARFKQWSGKQLKQKNNRRQNRIAYNHGKHRKK